MEIMFVALNVILMCQNKNETAEKKKKKKRLFEF